MGSSGRGADSEGKEFGKQEFSSGYGKCVSGNIERAVGYESGVQRRGRG